MPSLTERCRYCGATIPAGATVYGDHNRRFCSEACALAQLDHDQGTSASAVRTSGGDASPGGGDRVGPEGGPARRPAGIGPTWR